MGRPSRRIIASLAVSLAVLLIACRTGGGDTNTPTLESLPPRTITTPIPTAEGWPQGSPPVVFPATPRSTPSASPSVSPTASPGASPAALTKPVALAEALDNLEAQDSYVMQLDAAGFTGAETLLPGAGETFRITLRRSGDDRHVRVFDADGNRLVELWRVDGQAVTDVGAGPIAATSDTPIVGRFLPLLDLDTRFLRTLSGDDADYTITGTETVDGTPATVEEATYDVSGASRALLTTSDTATVASTMWVATEGPYLLRLDLTLTPTGATPATDTQPATAHVEVTDIGTAPPITAPAP